MSESNAGEASFRELLGRIQGGDQAAAYELVRRYELTIRVAVRARLSDPALRRQLDSMDICQSVLASFFLRVVARPYELHDPRQLVALLTKMAQRKLAMRARGHYRQRRDVRRTEPLSRRGVASREADPGRLASDRDLLQWAYSLMSPAVREMADLRMAGEQWSDIANKLGGTADGRRKQYQRAIDSIAVQLGLD